LLTRAAFCRCHAAAAVFSCLLMRRYAISAIIRFYYADIVAIIFAITPMPFA